MFKIIESKIKSQGQLSYFKDSHEFISEPRINSDTTILVGYIYYTLVLIPSITNQHKFGDFTMILIGNRVS